MPTEPPLAPEVAALRDGETVTIRPIRPDDVSRLQAFHTRLSPDTIYLRYLGQHRVLTDAEARRLTGVDYQARMALVATREHAGDDSVLGVARYDVIETEPPYRAEAAIVVEDQYQGKGLGVLLVGHLVAYARTHGVHAFVAEISAENARMMDFIRRSGLPVEKKLKSGVWEIEIKLNEDAVPT
jgi:GNAT superfamily N-acetyltransferase